MTNKNLDQVSMDYGNKLVHHDKVNKCFDIMTDSGYVFISERDIERLYQMIGQNNKISTQNA